MSITGWKYTMRIVRRRGNIVMAEITEDRALVQNPKRFYVFQKINGVGIKAIVPADIKKRKQYDLARFTVSDVNDLCIGRTRTYAMSLFRKITGEL